MRLYEDVHIQIAVVAAATSRTARAGHTDSLTLVYSLGNGHADLLVLYLLTFATTRFARRFYNLARAAAS